MSQNNSEEDEDDQESEEAEEDNPKILHLNPKDSQFNGDDDNEEVHTHKTQIKRRKRSMLDESG